MKVTIDVWLIHDAVNHQISAVEDLTGYVRQEGRSGNTEIAVKGCGTRAPKQRAARRVVDLDFTVALDENSHSADWSVVQHPVDGYRRTASI